MLLFKIKNLKKMKLNYKIISSILLATTLVSCDSYLDKKKKKVEAENYFNTESDYNDALIGSYDMLQSTYINNMIGEIASDNVLCGGENALDAPGFQQIDDMIHTNENDQLRSVWQWMYAGINRCNYITEFQDKTNFANKPNVLGQNAFLKAYYYFELVKFFGDVPLFVDKRLAYGEETSLTRTPKAEVYAQIEKELQYAVDNLPWTQTQKGRVTKGAALALLGKVYLYQNKFAEAKTTLDQVINSGQYSLITDYTKIFGPMYENNTESVFEVQYTGTQGAGFECLQCVDGNIAVGFYSPRFSSGNYSPYADGFSFGVPVKDLYDAYDSADTRRDASILDIEAFIASTPANKIKYNKGYEHTGYFNKKYIAYAEKKESDPHLTSSNNYIAIRYSDVLLMAAEAYNRGGFGDTKALEYLNAVISRAYGNNSHNSSATGTVLATEIYKQRHLEFAGEGQRFFDLVRIGQAATKITGFATGKNEVFPIPLVEIQLSGNHWQQNPGY